ncbi:MAG: dockerin type I domain-containing protein [Anaerolineales bacterium]
MRLARNAAAGLSPAAGAAQVRSRPGRERGPLISTGLAMFLCVGGMQLGLPKPTEVRADEGMPTSAEDDDRALLSSPLPGQIVVDPANPEWLRYQGGGPFFMCAPGDPEGFLYRGTRNPDGARTGDQEALIAKLAGTGANGIYMMAIRSHGGDGGPSENPFVDSDPAQGLDDDILNQWEGWFTELDNQGVVAFLFLYDDGARVWDTGDSVGEEERAFVYDLVDRFEHHTHLIWAIAEEYSESYSAERVSNIAAEIRAADDHGHPIAVHKLNGLSFAEFADDPSIDQFAIQYTASEADGFHDAVVSAWKDAAGRYNLNLAEGHPDAFGQEARLRSWAVAMGGGSVMHLRWDIASSPIAELEDCGRLAAFMESTGLLEMAPHDELAFGGTDYVLALPGKEYIAYGADLSGEMGLRDMEAGTYTLRWMDIASGTMVTQTDVPLATGDQTWRRPPGVGTEVAVHVLLADSASLDGDINADGEVDVLDVQLCVNVLLGTETDPIIVDKADMNGDDAVDILDVQLVVNFLLVA